MSKSYRDQKFLYHLTTVENLPSILRHGLCSRFELSRQQIGYRNIADADILSKRGSLAGCVPFHFLCKSPFDHAVVKKYGDCNFVYLCVERVYAERNGWQIVPKHPLAGGAGEPLEWTDGMSAIDWSMVDSNIDWAVDPRPKQARMAEALGPSIVPITAIAAAIFQRKRDEIAWTEHLKDGKRWVIANPKMFPQNDDRLSQSQPVR